MQKNVQKHLVYITLPLAVGLLALILLTTFHGLRPRRTGVSVRVALDTCSCGDLDDQVIFLHVSAGGLSINRERVDRRRLAGLLSDIYRSRAKKVLYLSADDDVPFQAVADIVETVQHLPEGPQQRVPLPRGLQEPTEQMNLSIVLVTRKVVEVPCRVSCVNFAKQTLPVVQ